MVYISMGFGNPYGDIYNEAILQEWVAKLMELDIEILSLADTVGLATTAQVSSVLQALMPLYPGTEIGVHLHSASTNWQPKIEAALSAGCKRFDGALKGIGGCPMAGDELIGNMNTEMLIPYFEQKKLITGINKNELEICSRMAEKIFV